MQRTMTQRATASAAVMALAMTLGACGSDDDPPSAAAADTDSGDVAEFCEAFVAADHAIEVLPWDDPDAMAVAAAENVEPHFERIEGGAPAEVADAANTMVTTVRQVLSTGDFSGFEDPAFAAAQEEVFTYLGPACDLPTIEVAAVDFDFDGMPEVVPAGRAVVLMPNRSEAGELHEIAIARVNDGVELSAEEILALPEEEAFALVEFVTGTSAGAGNTAGTTVDLAPGRHIYYCLVPVGSVGGDHGDGPPHTTMGMYGEFDVEPT